MCVRWAEIERLSRKNVRTVLRAISQLRLGPLESWMESGQRLAAGLMASGQVRDVVYDHYLQMCVCLCFHLYMCMEMLEFVCVWTKVHPCM